MKAKAERRPRESARNPTSDLAKALRALEGEAKRRGYPVTREILADELEVARSAVSAWFAGATPRAKHLEGLANYFAFGDDKLRSRYRSDLFAAAGVAIDRSNARDPMVRARERSGVINIAVSTFDEYFPRFFQNVIGAFGRFCAFRLEITPVPFSMLPAKLADGTYDIGAGLFVTPDRLQTLKFIDTPITLALNAVCFANMRTRLELPDGFLNLDAIQPIMNEGQAGYQYAQHVLEISHLDIDKRDYNAEVFADTLLDCGEQWLKDNTKPVGVVITDELMCLRLHRELMRRMRGSSIVAALISKLGPPILLMDEPNQWRRQSGSRVATHPKFCVSLCVKRDAEPDWYQYIEDAWKIFLIGNIEFLQCEYTDLHQNLHRYITDLEKAVGDTSALHWQGAARNTNSKKVLVDDWSKLVDSWLYDTPSVKNHLADPWDKIAVRSANHASSVAASAAPRSM